MYRRFFSLFPAFQNNNYKLYFTGQLISLIGTWLQMIAQGWLVLQLTHSAFLLGLVAAIGTLPTLLFSLVGGVIVDRMPKRTILFFTQAASMVLAFILGFLTVFQIINVWQIAFLAFLLGTVNAVDAPARQAFVIEMVGRTHLASAIALNSGTFNGARLIGPSIAGFLIAIFGSGGAFIINGISYIAVIAALVFIKVKETVGDIHPHPLRAMKNGISYSLNHPIISTLLLLTAVTSVFGWSYNTIMPYIAQNVFHVGADGLGYLYAASGAGALLAVVVVSALSHRIKPVIFIMGGNIFFALGIIIFTFTANFILALLFLFMAGFGLLLQFSMMNSIIQHLVDDNYRGRVMSLYTLMFLGLFPVGNFQIGYLSENFGTSFAIRLGAVITLLFTVLLLFSRRKMKLS